MGISGGYVEKFSEANLASAVDVHMNGDYHFFFDVLEADGKEVTVKTHNGGEVWKKKIQRRNGREFFTYQHAGAYQAIFGGKAEVVKVVPFKGDKF